MESEPSQPNETKICSRGRRLLLWAAALAGALVLLLVGLDAYFELVGVPNFLVQGHVVPWLKESKGITADIGAMRAGLVSGIHLEDLVLRDAEISIRNPDDNRILEAPTARVQIFSSRGMRIRLPKAHAWIPLGKENAEKRQVLDLSELDLDLRLLSEENQEAGIVNQFIDLRMSAVAYDGVHVELERSILRRTLPLDAPPQPLTLKPLVDTIPPLARSIARRIEEAGAAAREKPIQIRVKLNSNLNDPNETRMDLEVDLEKLLYRGLYVDRAELSAELTPKAVLVHKLRLDLSEDEFLNATGRFDRKTKVYEATASGRLFPRQFLRAFAPAYLGYLKDIHFDGPPPIFKLSVLPTAIDQPLKGSYELDVQCSQSRFMDAEIIAARAKIAYTEKTLKVDAFRASIAPNVDISGNLIYHLEQGSLLARLQMDGDPNVLKLFWRDDNYRKGLDQAWSAFRFSPYARPRFQIDLYRSRAPVNFVLEGQMAAKSFYFNDILIDSMDGAVVVDLENGLVLVNRGELRRNGAPAIFQLAIDYGAKNPTVAFDVESNLDTAALLAIANKKIRNLLRDNGWSFAQTPYCLISGTVGLSADGGYNLQISAEAPKAKWNDFDGNGVTADLAITPDLIKVDVTADELHHVGWHYKNVKGSNLVIKDDTFRGAFTAASAQIADVTFKKPTLDLAYADNTTTLTNAVSDGVELTINNNEKLVTGKIKCPEIVIAGNRVTTQAEAEELRHTLIRPERSGATVNKIKADVTWEDGVLRLEGALQGLSYEPQKVKADTAGFSATLQKGVVNTDIDLPKARVGDSLQLQNASLHTRTENRETLASVEIKGLTYQDYKAENVSGSFSYQGNSWHISEAKAEKVSRPPVILHNVKGDAIYAYKSLNVGLSAPTMMLYTSMKKIGPDSGSTAIPIKDVSTSIQYQGEHISIPNFRGDVHSGRLSGQIRHNLTKNTTKVVMTLKQADLSKFTKLQAASASPETEKSDSGIKGLLTARVLLDLVHKPDDLFIHGAGNVFIQEATIWKMPLIADFFGLLRDLPLLGRFLSPEDFGKITKMQMDLSFKGHRIDLTRANSDGNVVAVEMNGYYWWKTNGLDIRIRSEIFKAGLFKKFFVRRLIGSVKHNVWEKWPFFKDLFRDDAKPEDPTTKEWYQRLLAEKRIKRAKEIRAESKEDAAEETEAPDKDTSGEAKTPSGG